MLTERGQVEVGARRTAVRTVEHYPRRSGVARGGVTLEPDSADAIVKRMRRAWIRRKAGQPLNFQAACRIFKNPQHGGRRR